MNARPTPYKITPVFDENTLPTGLRREHPPKAGVWDVIRVRVGRSRYEIILPPAEAIVEPGHSGLVMPEQPHRSSLSGPCGCRSNFSSSARALAVRPECRI